MKKIFGILIIILVLAGCTQDVAYLKVKGPAFLQTLGWITDGYEGYQWGFWGGKVWYQIHRKETPWAIYSIYLIERNGEIHFYSSESMNPTAVIPGQTK